MTDLESLTKTDGVHRHELEERLRWAQSEIKALRISDQERTSLCDRLHTAIGDFVEPGEHYADGAARLLRDHDAMLENLTHAQERGTAMLDLARANKRIANASHGLLHAIHHVVHERSLQDARFGTPEALLHVPFGTGEVAYAETLKVVRESAAMHCEETGRETCCWAHVVLEEAFEVAEETDVKALRQEFVQLGAVCVRVIEAIDLGAKR